MDGGNREDYAMPTLNIPRPKARYNCSQDELYALADVMAGNYDRHKERFKAKSTKYTDQTGQELRDLVRDAMLIPDEVGRAARHAGERRRLGMAAVECLRLWNQLTGYIRDGVPPVLYRTRLNMAGKTHYARAQNDEWEQVDALMVAGKKYIGANEAGLVEGGMVPGFPTAFADTKNAFHARMNAFRDAEKAARTDGDAKLNLNNVVFAQVMRLCEDGRRFFHDNAAIRSQFTFVALMRLIRHHVRKHKVHGEVKQDGQPVVYALLLLQKQMPTGEYGVALERRTDVNGHFLFTGIRKGRYRMTVRASGMEDRVLDVEVGDGPVEVGIGD